MTTKFGIVYDTCVFSIYGGVSLLTYFEIIEQAVYKDGSLDIGEFDDMIESLYELQYHVEEMNKRDFYHNDISHDNIVYDKTKHKARLVDFERAGFGKGNDIGELTSVINQFKKLLAMYKKKISAQAPKGTKHRKRKLTRKR
jgi:hypothetical protein